MQVIYCIDDKLGGVSSLNYNLVANRNDNAVHQCVLHILCREWKMARSKINFPATKQKYFEFSNKQNYYQTLMRLRQQIPDEAGALVVNYENEMAMLDHYPVRQTVYQLVHDDYNLNLAKKYGHIVDVFICHNSVIYQQLKDFFKKREEDIYYLPHGVSVPVKYRKSVDESGPLKLLFLGRMATEKGIFDLPQISNYLQEQNISFKWTCIGNGPELEKLKQVWSKDERVIFCSPKSNNEVIDICAESDVFVLPTKFEGSPVSLLETMSVGLVPVITDLPGGITDIVSVDIGFRIAMDDNAGFAKAIAKLDKDRRLLNTLSQNCRQKIVDHFDVRQTAAPYHALFSNYSQLYKEKKIKKLKVGARLDHPFIPNVVTKFIRSINNKI